MPQGTSYFPQDGDLLQSVGGAFRPANLTLIGSYTFTATQSFTATNTSFTGNSATAVNISIRNTNAGASAFSQIRMGSDATVSLGGLFCTSSTYAAGYGGANSVNLVNFTNAPLAFGTNNAINFSISGIGAYTQLAGVAPTANTFPGNQLMGCNNGTAATAGTIGEVIESKISAAQNAAATGTYLALTSISLTAGEWLVSAIANEEPGTGATTTAGGALEALIGTTSAASTGATRGYNWIKVSHAIAAADSTCLSIMPTKVSVTTTTTYYLNVMQTFTAGTPQWRGSILAQRVR